MKFGPVAIHKRERSRGAGDYVSLQTWPIPRLAVPEISLLFLFYLNILGKTEFMCN